MSDWINFRGACDRAPQGAAARRGSGEQTSSRRALEGRGRSPGRSRGAVLRVHSAAEQPPARDEEEIHRLDRAAHTPCAAWPARPRRYYSGPRRDPTRNRRRPSRLASGCHLRSARPRRRHRPRARTSQARSGRVMVARKRWAHGSVCTVAPLPQSQGTVPLEPTVTVAAAGEPRERTHEAPGTVPDL